MPLALQYKCHVEAWIVEAFVFFIILYREKSIKSVFDSTGNLDQNEMMSFMKQTHILRAQKLFLFHCVIRVHFISEIHCHWMTKLLVATRVDEKTKKTISAL